MVENKNKIPTFWVENQNFSQNFVFAFEKLIFVAFLDPDWGKNPGSGSVKNESGSEPLWFSPKEKPVVVAWREQEDYEASLPPELKERQERKEQEELMSGTPIGAKAASHKKRGKAPRFSTPKVSFLYSVEVGT